MRNGDLEFHQKTGPLIDIISNEGLRIARENKWNGLVIEITATKVDFSRSPSPVRCSLRDLNVEGEMDEPSAKLFEAANRLQEIFSSVGTPFAEAVIDWVDEDTDGRVQRRCTYRYL